MPSQGRRWYQSPVATCGSNLEETMVGSHAEEVCEQVRGRDPGPSTRGRKDKSRDAISSLERRFVRQELVWKTPRRG